MGTQQEREGSAPTESHEERWLWVDSRLQQTYFGLIPRHAAHAVRPMVGHPLGFVQAEHAIRVALQPYHLKAVTGGGSSERTRTARVRTREREREGETRVIT